MRKFIIEGTLKSERVLELSWDSFSKDAPAMNTFGDRVRTWKYSF